MARRTTCRRPSIAAPVVLAIPVLVQVQNWGTSGTAAFNTLKNDDLEATWVPSRARVSDHTDHTTSGS